MISSNIEVQGDEILWTDFKPPIVIGYFNSVLTNKTKKEIFNRYSYGSQILEIYEVYRRNHHEGITIKNVNKMIDEMEQIYKKFLKKEFEIKRQISN